MGKRGSLKKSGTGLGRRETLATADDYRHHHEEDAWTAETDMSTLEPHSFVFTQVTSLVTSGVLPFAAATIHVGWTWAFIIFITVVSGCAYTMWCLGRVVEITGKVTFRDQWALLISESTAWFPLLVIVVTLFGSCLCMCCLAAELFASSLQVEPNTALVAFAVFPVLPLVMLKSLAALAYTSIAACLVMVYVIIFMGVRYFDGTYHLGGIYYN
jgi:amino acid permease